MVQSKSALVAEVANDRVVRVKLEVPNASNVMNIEGDELVVDLPDEPLYDEFQENHRPALEQFAAIVGTTRDLGGQLERDWGRVYDKASERGQIILAAHYEHGVNTDDGYLVSYDDLKEALKAEDKSVESKTMAGIYRGLNTKIRDYVTGVNDLDEAGKVMKQVRPDDRGRCRIIVKDRDGRRHADAFKAAMEAKLS